MHNSWLLQYIILMHTTIMTLLSHGSNSSFHQLPCTPVECDIAFVLLLLVPCCFRGPHIVIAPASLLENWEREIQTWCPRLRIATYHGANKDGLRYQFEHWRRQVARALDTGILSTPPPGWIRPGQGGRDDEEDGGESEASGTAVLGLVADLFSLLTGTMCLTLHIVHWCRSYP